MAKKPRRLKLPPDEGLDDQVIPKEMRDRFMAGNFTEQESFTPEFEVWFMETFLLDDDEDQAED